MTKLDERRIIRILQRGMGGHDRFAGEDVEVFGRGARNAVVAIDTLVQSTDVPPGMRPAQISRKSVAACASDFAAKGVRPEYGTVSVVVPDGFSEGGIAGLARGFRRASEEFGIRILGGDTGGGRELVITVALYGRTAAAAAGGGIVPRGGAKTGDAIFVTGDFGHAAAGLRSLLRNRGPGSPRADQRFRNAFCNPHPRLEFGVRARRYLTSSMDSSDGLARTLNEMARRSGRMFAVSRLPCGGAALAAFAARNGCRAEDLVLFGGEEYEMVFTVPGKNVARVRGLGKRCGVKLAEIGTVRAGGGVFLERRGRRRDGTGGGGATRIPDAGWTHLAG